MPVSETAVRAQLGSVADPGREVTAIEWWEQELALQRSRNS